jgi:hypothetical protein
LTYPSGPHRFTPRPLKKRDAIMHGGRIKGYPTTFRPVRLCRARMRVDSEKGSVLTTGPDLMK